MTSQQVMDTLLLMGFVREAKDISLKNFSRYKLCYGPISRKVVVFVYDMDNDGVGEFAIHSSVGNNPRFSDGRSFMDEVVRRLEESANG